MGVQLVFKMLRMTVRNQSSLKPSLCFIISHLILGFFHNPGMSPQPFGMNVKS